MPLIINIIILRIINKIEHGNSLILSVLLILLS